MPRIRRARTLRENTTPQLIQELADATRQLYNQRFTFATQQVGDVKEIRNLRKEIARMRTILRERDRCVGCRASRSTPTCAQNCRPCEMSWASWAMKTTSSVLPCTASLSAHPSLGKAQRFAGSTRGSSSHPLLSPTLGVARDCCAFPPMCRFDRNTPLW